MVALLILAVALAMDALAVALVRGSVAGHHPSEAIRLGLSFGVAQGVMPLVGWSLGIAFSDTFRSVDHWIAFGLLVWLGVRMAQAGLGWDDPEVVTRTGVPASGLLVAAFATSIDAAAAGVTLPLLGVALPIACLVIGATTAVLCTAGYLVGARVSPLAGKRAEVAGGIVLIALGSKILLEHLTA